MGERESRGKDHSLSWHSIGKLQEHRGERLVRWVGSQIIVAVMNFSGRLGSMWDSGCCDPV